VRGEIEMIKKEKGFSLVEMLIVLMIMTTLLIIAVPNLEKHNAIVNEKSCDATINLVKAQAETYAIENSGTFPNSISDLSEYISKINSEGRLFCPGGEEVVISGGEVVKVDNSTASTTQ
jgi:competence protein ComGC